MSDSFIKAFDLLAAVFENAGLPKPTILMPTPASFYELEATLVGSMKPHLARSPDVAVAGMRLCGCDIEIRSKPLKRDLVSDFRDFADNPLSGSEFVPIHRNTLREAAGELERLRKVEAAAQKRET